MGTPGTPIPIPDSYCLIEGTLLAGEYPGAAREDAARAKLAKFLDAGIRTFVNLPETRDAYPGHDQGRDRGACTVTR